MTGSDAPASQNSGRTQNINNNNSGSNSGGSGNNQNNNQNKYNKNKNNKYKNNSNKNANKFTGAESSIAVLGVKNDSFKTDNFLVFQRSVENHV